MDLGLKQRQKRVGLKLCNKSWDNWLLTSPKERFGSWQLEQ